MRPLHRHAAQELGSVSFRYRSQLSRRSTGGITFSAARFALGCDQTSSAAVEDETSGISRLEAVLFLTKEPLHARKLAQLAKLADGTEARTLVGWRARRIALFGADSPGSDVSVVEGSI